MKSKDQMQGENRALKQQLAKTAEVITKVQEAEKSLIQKIVEPPLKRFWQFIGSTGTQSSTFGDHKIDIEEDIRKCQERKWPKDCSRQCGYSDRWGKVSNWYNSNYVVKSSTECEDRCRGGRAKASDWCWGREGDSVCAARSCARVSDCFGGYRG